MITIDGDVAIDDRGSVSFVNDFDFNNVKRFYMVENHSKGFVRAWHGHEKESKYVFVTKGAILLALKKFYSGDQDIETVTLSGSKPRVVFIPPGYYNGFKTLTDDAQVIFYSTSTLKESKGDDFREPATKWSYVWQENPR